MNQRILIVDDDVGFARLLEIEMRRSGYDVCVALTPAEALAQFAAAAPDLVMLDVELPEINGLEVCRRIRACSNVPILLMTGHAVSEVEIVRGLNLGADEYLCKPLRPLELKARIRALLRRAGLDGTHPQLVYRDDYLSVDLETRQVRAGGREVQLTPTEFKLLVAFLSHIGEVLTFRQLLDEVWGSEYVREFHYPRIYVSHLRRKIEPTPTRPAYILNEYGIGYRFVARCASAR